jgi:hypothetical protein
MTWLTTWIKMLGAWWAGESSQAATDLDAANKQMVELLRQRAKTDDTVRTMPDADVVRELQQWERGPEAKP